MKPIFLNKSRQSTSHIRLVIIAPYAPSLIRFRGPLIAEMVAKGVEVFALAPDYDEATRAGVNALGAKPVDYSLARAGMNPLRDIADILRLGLCLHRLKPTMVLAYSFKPIVYGIITAWLVGAPRRFALITGLGYAFTYSAKIESLKRRLLQGFALRLYKVALRRAETVFFQNDDDQTLFVNSRIVRSTQAVSVNGTGVDLDYWQPAPPVLRPVTFLLAARLLREKGIVEYIEAARRVKMLHPEARFILLGALDSNPGALSRAEVEAWMTEGIVEWPGHVADVRPWLAQTSVFVLPSSYREGMPRSIQEAMAMARPIITTNAPGCRETVIDGENGFLVPVRDVDALVNAMLNFIKHPELIERMGQASRKLAEERFDVRKVNQVMLKAMGIV
jgi:glycosyltransferase involved in cell wall biosynthesis